MSAIFDNGQSPQMITNDEIASLPPVFPSGIASTSAAAAPLTSPFTPLATVAAAAGGEPLQATSSSGAYPTQRATPQQPSLTTSSITSRTDLNTPNAPKSDVPTSCSADHKVEKDVIYVEVEPVLFTRGLILIAPKAPKTFDGDIIKFTNCLMQDINQPWKGYHNDQPWKLSQSSYEIPGTITYKNSRIRFSNVKTFLSFLRIYGEAKQEEGRQTYSIQKFGRKDDYCEKRTPQLSSLATCFRLEKLVENTAEEIKRIEYIIAARRDVDIIMPNIIGSNSTYNSPEKKVSIYNTIPDYKQAIGGEIILDSSFRESGSNGFDELIQVFGNIQFNAGYDKAKDMERRTYSTVGS